MAIKFFNWNNHPNRLLDPDEIFADSLNAVGSLHSSEGKIERPIGGVPSRIFLFIIAVGVIYLISRAEALQVAAGEKYFTKSQENRFFTRPVFPARGIVYDRSGKQLVENRPSFTIAFEKEEFLRERGDLQKIVSNLSEALGKSKEELWEAGFPKNLDPARLTGYLVIAQGIDPEEIVSIAPRIYGLPGVVIYEDFRRMYPDSFAFSHLLGFVGKVSAADLARFNGLSEQDTIGKNGIENAYDGLIRGKAGRKIVEVNASGKESRFKSLEEARAGKNIRVTIDGDLQKFAYKMLMHYTQGKKGGSAVAVDPRGGEVRALVSVPGFDSNRFGYSLSQKEFNAVLNDPLRPLFNRAISGEFPSGSTIKPLIAAAALQENIIDPNQKIYDPGFIEIPNPYKPGEKSVFMDWKKHGWVDFYDAIAVSANVYFYIIGGGYENQKGLGIEKIKQYALGFGLGSVLGIDIPGERPGLIPDPEWKERAEPSNPIWRIGDTYNVSIGQGGVRVTPLQMAMAAAAIANGGTLYQPHIFDGELDAEGNIKEKAAHKILREGMVKKEVIEKVVKGMEQTVTAGTAQLFRQVPVPVAAKTGTAEAGAGDPHSWVIAFAPIENPEIAIAAMVEHAGGNSVVAVQIAGDILKRYFANR